MIQIRRLYRKVLTICTSRADICGTGVHTIEINGFTVVIAAPCVTSIDPTVITFYTEGCRIVEIVLSVKGKFTWVVYNEDTFLQMVLSI